MATDHAADISALRHQADMMEVHRGTRSDFPTRKAINDRRLAADLLEIHDATGISLDHWGTATAFVRHFTGHDVAPNGA